MGCHFLVQAIFLTQGPNLSLLPWHTDSLPLSHLGGPYKYNKAYAFRNSVSFDKCADIHVTTTKIKIQFG